MSEPLSMLVPLQTLAGWPEAPDPSPLVELGLLIGLPVVVIIAFFAIAKFRVMVHVAKTGGGVQVTDPIWMGGQARSIMEGSDPNFKAIAAGEAKEIEASAPAESGTGGAGARW